MRSTHNNRVSKKDSVTMVCRPSNGRYVLGVFCYFHDASACLIHNGQLVAMAEEERFTRRPSENSIASKQPL